MFYAIAVSMVILYVSSVHANCPPNSPDTDWCYKDSCGPNSAAWPPLCHNGERQTPIDLPQSVFPTGMANLRLQGYRGNHFRMQNNGHTVAVDFVGESGSNEGPTSKPFLFPDPLLVNKMDPAQQKIRKYNLASFHLHWGQNDSLGSEHCIAKRCSAMELHLVHYLADYPSLGEALSSCDENALAVLGVLLDPNPVSGSPGSPLAPIAKHLSEIENPNSKSWTSVNESLDLTQLFLSEEIRMYSYKGSLTTPKCNEQVNWYVMRRPALITREELHAFRTMLMDSHKHVLDENFRPLQERNGREVIFSDVFPNQKSGISFK